VFICFVLWKLWAFFLAILLLITHLLYMYYVSFIVAYITINSNKIASNRRVYGSDRGNNPEVIHKLSGTILAR